MVPEHHHGDAVGEERKSLYEPAVARFVEEYPIHVELHPPVLLGPLGPEAGDELLGRGRYHARRRYASAGGRSPQPADLLLEGLHGFPDVPVSHIRVFGDMEGGTLPVEECLPDRGGELLRSRIVRIRQGCGGPAEPADGLDRLDALDGIAIEAVLLRQTPCVASR